MKPRTRAAQPAVAGRPGAAAGAAGGAAEPRRGPWSASRALSPAGPRCRTTTCPLSWRRPSAASGWLRAELTTTHGTHSLHDTTHAGARASCRSFGPPRPDFAPRPPGGHAHLSPGATPPARRVRGEDLPPPTIAPFVTCRRRSLENEGGDFSFSSPFSAPPSTRRFPPSLPPPFRVRAGVGEAWGRRMGCVLRRA